MTSVFRLLRSGLGLGGIVAAAAILLPSAAQARLVQPSGCQPDPSLFAQPFTSLGDNTLYQLAGGPYSLSDGDSVLTSPACANVSHPLVRFFVVGDPSATVSVAAVFDTGQATVAIPLGTVPAGSGVSPAMALDVVNVPSLKGQNAEVTLRLSVQGGSAEIGTVWVDPWGGV